MKIRKGFVSNSSSSCFICGLWGDNEYSIKEMIPILQKMLDFYNDLEEESLSFDDVFKLPEIATTEDFELLKNWDVDKKKVKGKILIYGKEDNSIPYMLHSIIETKFSADRIHLG